MSDRLYIDIETIPAIHLSDDEQFDLARAAVPGNLKKSDTIAKWLIEHGDEAFAKTALKSMAGHIIAVGMAFDDGEVKAYCDADEGRLLADVSAAIDKDTVYNTVWIGHCLKMFDLPFLRHRAFALGFDMLANRIPHDKWGKLAVCTMELWAGTNYREYYRLDAIREYLGMLDRSGGFDGSMVYAAYLDGELDRIADYCREDVELVRNVYRKIR